MHSDILALLNVHKDLPSFKCRKFYLLWVELVSPNDVKVPSVLLSQTLQLHISLNASPQSLASALLFALHLSSCT